MEIDKEKLQKLVDHFYEMCDSFEELGDRDPSECVDYWYWNNHRFQKSEECY